MRYNESALENADGGFYEKIIGNDECRIDGAKYDWLSKWE